MSVSEDDLIAIINRIVDRDMQASVAGKVFPSMRLLHLDLETASTLDLRKVGASAYSRHPTTVVTVIAWAFGDDPVSSVTMPRYLPVEVSQHLASGGKFVAWNAAFEWAFLTNWFGLRLASRQAICSMQRALHAGLPAKLEHAGAALKLAPSLLKDTAGHRLMMQMCRPKKDGTFWHDSDPAKLADLEAYCKQDVIAERAVCNLTPELPAYEKAVSRLDRVANDKGIRLDIPLIHALIGIAKEETQKLDAECKALTGGNVTSPGTQTQRLLSWLWGQGVKMATVGKEEVQDTLDTAPEAELSPLGTKVLAIRQKVAKSSVKKLQSMLNTVDDDGRVRGTLQYYGAARTGRFSGRLIQPQNFPRPPKGWNPLDAINAILGGLRNDGLGIFYGEPLSVVSACLRGCLIPSDGKQFLVFDLSQIEARVLAWLAGQNDVLEVFRRGEDVYSYTSNRLGLGSRQAGKVAVLGLGFGMGHEAFVDFALTNGLRLTKMESLEIVTAWRDANAFIREFWWDLDAAARQAISNPGLIARVRGITMSVTRSHGDPCLLIKLPSGRFLWYRNPRIVMDPATHRDSIVFDGVDQYTKQWQPIRTWGSKLAENITQAVARDVIVEAALRVSGPYCELVLSVHDEVLFEVDRITDLEVADAKAKIETPPAWAHGLPVACEGGILTERYGKL